MPHSATGYGEIRIGRFYVVEMEKATESTDGKLSLTGQESSPPTTPAALVTFLHGQVSGIQEGKLVPVQFRDKAERNGYYAVTQASSDLTDYQGEVAIADWSMELQRQGSDKEVDLQSRLTGAIRSNDFSLAGTRWHAPAIGHYGYYTGTSLPSGSVTRSSEDGSIKVYLGVPSGNHPKWGCTVANFYGGRVRLNDTLEVTSENEVEGINRTLSATGWTMSNGLIRVSWSASAGGQLNVEAYTGGAWHSKFWSIFDTSSTQISTWDSASLLRNDFEQVVLRLTRDLAPGRLSLDISLRRGARFLEGYIQRSTVPDQMKVRLNTAETNATSLASAGYVTATANDTDGNRFVAGSAHTFTGHANGGVQRNSATTMDFFVGIVAGGGTAVTGDAATDIRDQYIATLPELTYAVRR